MVRPQKEQWGVSCSLRPWKAWAILTDLRVCSRLMGPPRWSRDAYVGGVCHCLCGGDRCSQHAARLVLVIGSFGCLTIATRTRYLIPHILPDLKVHLEVIPFSV